AIGVLLSYLFFPGEAVKTARGPFNLASWPQITLLCLALMFPVAFLSGILFPSIVARVQASVGDRMNSTGITTLFNTTGAAIGPLLASFVLLPSIGFQWSLISCAGGYALLSILVSERSSWSFRRPIGFIIAGLYAALIFDVGHGPDEPTLHEIVRLSAFGFSSGIRRRAAYLLRLRCHCGCVSSRIAR